MENFIKSWKVAGIVVGVVLLTVILDLISFHYALSYWMLASVIALPIIYWKRWRFRTSVSIAAVIAIALTLSPIDLRVMPGKPGISVLPTSHGFARLPGTVGYGCGVRNPPSKTVVLSF